ncbi:MAG: hypothetical protein ACLQVY_22925 [Limisphaerales bacterium]
MNVLRHTLVCDGPTDANLIPIIDWTLKEVAEVQLTQGVQATLWKLPQPPHTFAQRIRRAVEFFPCEVLFVHRDAEREEPACRDDEIRKGILEAESQGCRVPAVAIIPVRMLEAWLLFDERAIRRAAGNPNGTIPLGIPSFNRIEERPNPKRDLQEALKTASELTGRRLQKFNVRQAFWRIVDFIDDFSPLRKLPAYKAFEDAVRCASARRWQTGFYGIPRA